MFGLQRFHWKRRRAALVLLPAAALMVMTGFAAAANGTAVPLAGTGAGAPIDSGVKLKIERHARTGETVKFSGTVNPEHSARVAITVDGNQIETVQAGDDGRFSARWSSPSSGTYRVRAAIADTGAERARSDSERLNVYRSAAASYYGPGLYGNGTACGGRLTPSTLGVAHKTLPCGTKVTLRYRRRTVSVPVIDRGPYAGNREYDLTAATKAKLRFGSTGNVLTTR